MPAPYVAPFENFPPPRRVTVEEYLAAEATAFVRHEFLDGLVRAMPGVGKRHAWVTAALGDLVGPALRARGPAACSTRTSRSGFPSITATPTPTA